MSHRGQAARSSANFDVCNPKDIAWAVLMFAFNQDMALLMQRRSAGGRDPESIKDDATTRFVLPAESVMQGLMDRKPVSRP